uniref:hypothetical protein n=1 Tax=Salmonella sp. SAL4444 TaxID=3159899 RepID=UPI003979F8B1
INNSSTALLVASVTDAEATGMAFSPDYQRTLFGRRLYDTATRTLITELSFDVTARGSDGLLWNLSDSLGTSGGPFLQPFYQDGQF